MPGTYYFLELPPHNRRQQTKFPLGWNYTSIQRKNQIWWVIFDACTHLTCSPWGGAWDEWNQRKISLNYDLRVECLCKTTNFQTWYHKAKCGFVISGKKECLFLVTGESLPLESLRSHVGERVFLHLKRCILQQICFFLMLHVLMLQMVSVCFTHLLIN